MIVAPTASTGNTTIATGLFIQPPYTITWQTPYWSSLNITAPTSPLTLTFQFIGCSGSLSGNSCSGTTVNMFTMGLNWSSGNPQTFTFGVQDWYVGTGNSVTATVTTKSDTLSHKFVANFNGTFVSVSVDGSTFIQTNLLKNPLPVFQINLNATLGNSPYQNSNVVSYLDVASQTNWTGILGTIIPLVIVTAVIGTVIGFLTTRT